MHHKQDNYAATAITPFFGKRCSWLEAEIFNCPVFICFLKPLLGERRTRVICEPEYFACKAEHEMYYLTFQHNCCRHEMQYSEPAEWRLFWARWRKCILQGSFVVVFFFRKISPRLSVIYLLFNSSNVEEQRCKLGDSSLQYNQSCVQPTKLCTCLSINRAGL